MRRRRPRRILSVGSKKCELLYSRWYVDRTASSTNRIETLTRSGGGTSSSPMAGTGLTKNKSSSTSPSIRKPVTAGPAPLAPDMMRADPLFR